MPALVSVPGPAAVPPIAQQEAVPRLGNSITFSTSLALRSGAGVANAARGGGAAADFLQSGGAQRAAAGVAGGAAVGAAAAGRARADAGRPGTAGQNLSQNRPSRIENAGERQGDRDQRRDEVRDQFEHNNPGNFWQENPGWTAWAVTRPFAWADWNSVGSWCGYSGEPTSYNYGEDIYYSDGEVYSGDEPIATAEEYADEAATIASSAPSETPARVRLDASGRFRTYAGRRGFRSSTVAIHAACD